MAIKLTLGQFAALRQPRPREPRPARKPQRNEEAALLRAVLGLLKARRVWHFRCNAGVGQRNGRPIRGAPPGTPDVLAVVAGRLIGIECKSSSGTLRPAQAAWRDAAERAGAVYWVVKDVRDLDALLRGQGVS